MSTPFFLDMLVLLVMAGLNGRSSSEFAMEKTAVLLGLERNHIPFCEATDLHMSSLHRAGCFALALGRCHLPQGGHRAWGPGRQAILGKVWCFKFQDSKTFRF